MAEVRASPMDVKYIDAITSYPINTKVREKILNPLCTVRAHSSPPPKRIAKFSPRKKNKTAVSVPSIRRISVASFLIFLASSL